MLLLNPRQLDNEPIEIRRAIGSIICGFPSPAQDYGDVKRNVVENLAETLIRDPASMFLMDAYGTSMYPSIFDGDLLGVDRGITPRPGDPVVAVLDGEFTAKRLFVEHGHPVLRSDNPEHVDIDVPELSEFTIWGCIVWVIRRSP